MRRSVVQALRLRGVDVVTASEAGLIRHPDEEQLGYATSEDRVLYSFNVADFMFLHRKYIADGKHHSGIILAQQQRYNTGEQTSRLLRLIGTKSAEMMPDSVEFLSAWGRD